MRMICAIAQREGEDLSKAETRLACLQVFALDGAKDGTPQGDYFSSRAVFTQIFSGVTGDGIDTVLPKYIASVAAELGLPVATKIGVELVPAIGAVTGSTINVAFTNHYRDRAPGHFTMRRLIRSYGEERIESCYQALKAAADKSPSLAVEEGAD